jgi:hypothetical protein
MSKRKKPRKQRSPIPLSMLLRLSGEQNHRCCYCGCRTHIPTNRGQPAKDAATVEHVLPVAGDGRNHWGNLVMACSRCNGRRQTFDAFCFYDQQFWRTENYVPYKLAKMRRAFMRNPNPGLLMAMGEVCSERDDFG